MLYFIEIYKNPLEYWDLGDFDGWDAWYLFRRNWRDIYWLITRLRVKISYNPTHDRPAKWFSIHYFWYDGPHYSVWFWRFNIGA